MARTYSLWCGPPSGHRHNAKEVGPLISDCRGTYYVPEKVLFRRRSVGAVHIRYGLWLAVRQIRKRAPNRRPYTVGAKIARIARHKGYAPPNNQTAEPSPCVVNLGRMS